MNTAEKFPDVRGSAAWPSAFTMDERAAGEPVADRPYRLSRRAALAGAFTAAAVGAGARFLGAAGRMPQAAAACSSSLVGTCSTSGLSYRSNCGTGAYTATCTDGGCDPRYSVGASAYCTSTTFGSRHRTCGENNVVDGNSKEYRIRPDQCYGGGYDGWKWSGVDDGSWCGCTYGARMWSCNDGWLRSNGAGDWCSSICVTQMCPL